MSARVQYDVEVRCFVSVNAEDLEGDGSAEDEAALIVLGLIEGDLDNVQKEIRVERVEYLDEAGAT